MWGALRRNQADVTACRGARHARRRTHGPCAASARRNAGHLPPTDGSQAGNRNCVASARTTLPFRWRRVPRVSIVFASVWLAALSAEAQPPADAMEHRAEPDRGVSPRIELRGGAAPRCAIASSTPDLNRSQACKWDEPTAFSITWNAREVRLTVGATTIRQASPARAGNAIRLSASG